MLGNRDILKASEQSEYRALKIVQKVYDCEFTKSESPDFYSKDGKICVEVTRAFSTDYEKNNGAVIEYMRNGKKYSHILLKGFISGEPDDVNEAYSDCANLSVIFSRIKDSLVKKMKKLKTYKCNSCKIKCLFIDTPILYCFYDLRDLLKYIEELKKDIMLKYGDNDDYKCFDIVILNGLDTFVIFNWYTDMVHIDTNWGYV